MQTVSSGRPLELSANAQRVLGALAEKEMTVPDTYPLTSNAIVTAANQTTSRFPVMDLSHEEVMAAVHDLRIEHRLVRMLPSGSGSRVDKFRHVLEDRLGLTRPEKAIIAVLLLRGPQTLSEIKTRTQRMYDFADIATIDGVLDRLCDPTLVADPSEQTDARDSGMLRTASTAGAVVTLPDGYNRTWPSPLVVRLERQPGQHEPRVMHLLGGEVDAETIATEGTGPLRAPASSSTSTTGATASAHQTDLMDRVAVLESEVAALREEFAALKNALGA
jgi:uncharacterized protein